MPFTVGTNKPRDTGTLVAIDQILEGVIKQIEETIISGYSLHMFHCSSKVKLDSHQYSFGIEFQSIQQHIHNNSH